MGQGMVFRTEELDWFTPAEHYGAYSKLLVGPGRGSDLVDFRISLYPPSGRVVSHKHTDSEQIWYILRGTGAVDLDGKRYVVEPNTVIFTPVGSTHAIANTGNEDLLFVIVSIPPAADVPRSQEGQMTRA